MRIEAGGVAGIMAQLFASGRAVDLVLGVVALEFMVLVVVLRRPWIASGLMLLPAILLLLALRAALSGAAWPAIAALLALSFPAHLADLACRQRSRGAG